jgi:hypothetical protein
MTPEQIGSVVALITFLKDLSATGIIFFFLYMSATQRIAWGYQLQQAEERAKKVKEESDEKLADANAEIRQWQAVAFKALGHSETLAEYATKAVGTR